MVSPKSEDEDKDKRDCLKDLAAMFHIYTGSFQRVSDVEDEESYCLVTKSFV